MPIAQGGGGLVTSGNIVDGSIINADINSAADIARSKLKASDFAPKVLATTRDIATASGTQTIAHGLGRTPILIEIKAVLNTAGSAATSLAFLASDGTTVSSWHAGIGGDDNANVDGTEFRIYSGSAGASGFYATGTVTFDATNIYIAWVKQDTPTGTIKMIITVQ